MKASPLFILLLASVAACSVPAESNGTQVPVNAEVGTQSAILADLGGTPVGPIFTEQAGETLALSGYDAVSYFTGDAPVEGDKAFTVRYQGYEYQFSSIANAEKFQEDPAKYAPQYGGYCAWAIGANDALAPGDPKVYKIVDGKLYLNFNDAVSKRWNADIPGFVAKADVNYPKHDASEHYTTN